MKHYDAWIKLSDDEKEAELIRAEKYWNHHDKHGSSLKAIRERAKLFPGGIPMRPIPKKLRDDPNECTNFLNPDNYRKAVELDKFLKKKLTRASRKRTPKRATG